MEGAIKACKEGLKLYTTSLGSTGCEVDLCVVFGARCATKAPDPAEAGAQLGRGQERTQGDPQRAESCHEPAPSCLVAELLKVLKELCVERRRSLRKRRRSEKSCCNSTRRVSMIFSLCKLDVAPPAPHGLRKEKQKVQKKEWRNLTEKAVAWLVALCREGPRKIVN